MFRALAHPFRLFSPREQHAFSCFLGLPCPVSSLLSRLISGVCVRIPLADGSVTGYLPRNLATDGSRVFFDTDEAIVPKDSNGVADVYEWREGSFALISRGNGGQRSVFLDASVDGKDLFFTAGQRLVPSDMDNARDLYDACVGGTSEVIPRAPCVGDECQGNPSSPPSFSTPGSATLGVRAMRRRELFAAPSARSGETGDA